MVIGNSILTAIKMVIVGHQKQLKFLEAAKDGGRLGHAYILSGPAKVGKKTVALQWLSGMFCQTLCEGCAHPDFLFIEPLTDAKTGKKSGEITVDQIRGLIRKLSLKPSISKIKAAVIDESHLMNLEAQNALLKTLEEPPGNSLIILVAENSQRLLETIRSRCEILQFNFVSEREMQTCAGEIACQNGAKADEAKTKEIVKLSFGRPGRMMEFIGDESSINKWREDEKEFEKIVRAELPKKFAYVKKITDVENPEMDLNEIIEVWQFYFRNLMLEMLNGKKGEVTEQKTAAKPQFVFSKTKENPYTLGKIAAILKKIHELNVILMTTNANPKLAIENFMLDL